MIHGKANVVVDGQWGSTGKGKLCGYLALRHDIAAVICDFMSNAGHTFVSSRHGKIVTCQLPTGIVNEDAIILINGGAAITVDKLLQEIEENDKLGISTRLFIHPHATIITQEDRDAEALAVGKISSTLKGCGGALSRKVMRVAKLAKDEPRLKQWVADTTIMTHVTLQSGGTVLVEGAQGFDLSLTHGHSYPYVTSRNVTPMSIMDNAAIPFPYLGDVYGCLRTYPIRVGNTYDADGNMSGYSGPYYSDQQEITWENLEERSGCEGSLIERTTVTKKIRRVFTFSNHQLWRFLDTCAPTKLFVNFINHIDAKSFGCRTVDELTQKTHDWLNELELAIVSHTSNKIHTTRPGITHIGTGADDEHMISIEE